MKKYALTVVLVLSAVMSVFASGSAESADDGVIRIGISKLMSHAALDAAEQGEQTWPCVADRGRIHGRSAGRNHRCY